MATLLLNQQSCPVDLSLIPPLVEAALQAELGRVLEVRILLCEDEVSAWFNQRYRGAVGPTDVLAFPQEPGPAEDPAATPLGDVVIAVPTARRQAEEYGWSVAEELALLALHGVLHLLGYRDEQEEERHQMQAAEARYFERVWGRSIPRVPVEG